MRATLIREQLPNFVGAARLYRVEPPISLERDWDEETKGLTTEYVVVSAVVAYSGPETYIFPADAEGNVTNWGELNGSFRGDMDHERALVAAGYVVQ